MVDRLLPLRALHVGFRKETSRPLFFISATILLRGMKIAGGTEKFTSMYAGRACRGWLSRILHIEHNGGSAPWA